MKNILKEVSHSFDKGSKSIGHVFTNTGKKIEGAVSDVYHDTTSAASYAGKHIIKDVDTLSSAISSPMLWLVVGGVVIVVLMRR